MTRAISILFVLVLLPLAAVAEPDAEPTPQKELGRVAWLRDHDAAFEQAKAEQKPVFILFQEVPG